ncbi:MAG: hypothetical protein AAFY12_11855 [Pseudomonadota bacterium]
MGDFDTIQEEIDWARGCAERASAIVDSYLEEDPFSKVIKIDPATGEHVHVIKMIDAPPNTIRHLVRNSVLDLKYAYDRSIYCAARRFGIDSGTYPWADSRNGFKARIRKRLEKPATRLPNALIKELFRQKPYTTPPGPSGSPDLTREIAKMANGKHSIGIEIKPVVTGLDLSRGLFVGGVSFGGQWDPVNKELELFRHPAEAKVIPPQSKITIDIVFEHTGVLGTYEAFGLITQFADRAEACLKGFKRVCAAAGKLD